MGKMKYQLLSNLQQMLNNWLTLLSNCSIKYNLFSKYMADTEQQVASNTDQQVTSKTATTRQKNPKRVAAGKAVAERTRIAREAQRKAVIEAQSIIANKQTKPLADPPVSVELPPETTKNVLATTQWLSIISIVVSLAGVYYKREEIKNVLTKKADPPLPRAPPPSPRASPARIKQMD